VASRTAAAIARYNLVVSPCNRHLVDQFHSRIRLGLQSYQYSVLASQIPLGACT
jgi:hypothetical protein